MSSALVEFLLNCTSPLTLEDIASQVGRDQHEVEEELESLLRENSIRKRLIKLKSDDNDTNVQYKSIYWTSSLIPFISHEPIITSPFQLPFEHYTVLERLTDQQLQQEKIWLQTKLRKINSEYENLLHRSKLKYTEEDEELLKKGHQKNFNAKKKKMNRTIRFCQWHKIFLTVCSQNTNL